MTPNPEVQERLRRYLLGQLVEEAREEIEKDLLAQDEVFEELLVVEDELIDEYLNGELAAVDRAAFENHFLSTPERHDQLRFGSAFQKLVAQTNRRAASETNVPPRPWEWTRAVLSPPFRIAVLGIVVVGIGVGAWWLYFRQSEVDKGLQALNAACRNSRPIEGRISDLSYAPYLLTRGGTSSQTDQEKLRLAELDFKQALKAGTTSEALHGLGKVYLARQEFDKAIEQFEKALPGDSADARLYNDLGIAWMEKGLSGGGLRLQSAEGQHALEYLNQAIQLDSRLSEAIFNRALCHERLGQTEAARQDWKTYLGVDPNSAWAGEAREQLRKIS